MIVQTAANGQTPWVIQQLEHTALAGRLAAAWGNETFAPIEPNALMLYVIAHHDEGWDELDQNIGQDPDTGLPYNLVKTPLPQLIKTGARGANLNEAHHPFCGLISSMHTYGLYHGRYGMSDKVFVDMIPHEHRPAVQDMLGGELARQQRLKDALVDDPQLKPWVEEPGLMHNYKLLQFFDTLALYFNCTHETARSTETFHNVPRTVGDDVRIEVRRITMGQYQLSPFPFRESGIRISVTGRRLVPQPPGTDIPAALSAAPSVTEIFSLVAP